MAEEPYESRKRQILETINEKRSSLQGSESNPRKKVRAQPIPTKPLGTQGAATPDQSIIPPSIVKASSEIASQLLKLPVVGPLVLLVKTVGGKVPAPLLKKEVAKPILLGLGASALVVALIGGTRSYYRQRKDTEKAVKKAAQPSVAFLLLKTLLSVSQPALKQIVTNEVKKRF